MDANSRCSIRFLLLYTLAFAVLAAVPIQTPRVVVPFVGAGLIWLAYNATFLAFVTYPLWRFFGRHPVVPAAAMLLFAANFGPEIVFVVDFMVTGGNDTTGYWLAERRLDYDPLLSVPCWCSIAGSG